MLALLAALSLVPSRLETPRRKLSYRATRIGAAITGTRFFGRRIAMRSEVLLAAVAVLSARRDPPPSHSRGAPGSDGHPGNLPIVIDPRSRFDAVRRSARAHRGREFIRYESAELYVGASGSATSSA